MAEVATQMIGHSNQWQQIRKIISENLQSGSFLLAGPEGVGKKKMALALVQNFLCDTHNSCGHCGSCHRVLGQTHEGLLVIDHEHEMLKIEVAQKIKDFLKLKSLSAGRFIIINNAHLMNMTTSNALLKTLEEPPEGVFFFLISSRLSGLLMTIKSRCRLIPFSILNEKELTEVSQLNQYSLLNFRYSGQMHLVSKAQDKEFQPLVNLACDILNQIADRKFISLTDSQKAAIKIKEQFLDLVTYLEILIRDILLTQSCEDSQISPEIYFEEYTEVIRNLSRIDNQVWSKLFAELSLKKEDLYLSPDSALFIESLVIENIRSVN